MQDKIMSFVTSVSVLAFVVNVVLKCFLWDASIKVRNTRWIIFICRLWKGQGPWSLILCGLLNPLLSMLSLFSLRTEYSFKGQFFSDAGRGCGKHPQRETFDNLLVSLCATLATLKSQWTCIHRLSPIQVWKECNFAMSKNEAVEKIILTSLRNFQKCLPGKRRKVLGVIAGRSVEEYDWARQR